MHRTEHGKEREIDDTRDDAAWSLDTKRCGAQVRRKAGGEKGAHRGQNNRLAKSLVGRPVGRGISHAGCKSPPTFPWCSDFGSTYLTGFELVFDGHHIVTASVEGDVS